jgi:hypothetical protein
MSSPQSSAGLVLKRGPDIRRIRGPMGPGASFYVVKMKNILKLQKIEHRFALLAYPHLSTVFTELFRLQN